jgi:hypothetical protein
MFVCLFCWRHCNKFRAKEATDSMDNRVAFVVVGVVDDDDDDDADDKIIIIIVIITLLQEMQLNIFISARSICRDVSR